MNSNIAKVAEVPKFLYEYPLTQGQAALWFHYKLAPQSVAYNLAGAVTVPGDTDLEALQHAFQKLAERHPMLRTLFASQHGEPLQRIYPSLEIAFQVEDASKWDIAKLNARLAEEIYRPFDLELGPTWRVMVFQRAPLATKNNHNGHPKDHLVLLVLHHIIVDLWSVAIIMSEVAALYRQEISGTPAKLKPLRFSYADHIHKEAERLAGRQAETARNYWQTILTGELSPLNLPVDRTRPPVSTGRGADHSILLNSKLTNELRSLAETQHIPIHTILLSAFQVLLHRYSGQNDILVGFPKAGRSPSTVRVVGYFVNQMVVRANFSEDPNFIDFLKGIQRSLDAGASHDWYPFSLLVQDLQQDRDLSRSALIQAVFSWQRAPNLIPANSAGPFVLGRSDQVIEFGDLAIRSVHLPQRVSPFDLMMLAAEAPEGLIISIEYASDLFETGTIARMAESYRTLLESIASAPKNPVSELKILPESEQETLLETWNASAAPYPTGSCLQQLIEKQVERTPEATAVASGEERLSYRQLNQRANQLAHFLQTRGVGPNSLVGVFLKPSVPMVIALLGILKAGGAYLPLDPTNPKERLAYMLADARPSLLITDQTLLPHSPDFSGALFLMDADEARLRNQPKNNPSSSANPDHLAYVIYTSGSTGQPKGVMLAHRGVVNLLSDFQHRRAILAGDGCSWWTSPGFDVSVYEIFSPLLAGGVLHVIPDHLRLDASRLFDWLSAHHIRSAYLPPFFLEDFVNWLQSHPGDSSLRRLLVGVEPILDSLLIHIQTLQSSLSIINGYGPTEATICSTLYPVDSAHPRPGNTPIGRPVANTQIYLLDQALKPVPVGVVGELYIGGLGLAHGYHNRPELTAQRFIQSPFRSGERLYKTGDLAHYLPDGNLMFVGRSDTQVKLHGVRIELGEIETTLVGHPQVKQAVVLLYEHGFGGKKLVAYITLSEGASVSIAEELRPYLERRLPVSMVPANFVVLDAFPLTSSGKVDRKVLPVPQKQPPAKEKAYRPPQSETERILASIWQQVLGVESVGIDDNFFELGGDSIMSLQVVAHAAEAGLYLRPRHVFQAPTIAGLAALAGTSAPPGNNTETNSDAGVIPLTPIQHWFFEQDFPNPNHWNQSLMFITQQPLDPVHLRSAVSALLRQHDALRLRFHKGSSGWQQTCVEASGEVPLEVIDLSDLSETQQRDAIQAQAAALQNSLDLSAGPLIRVVYFVLGTGLPGRLLIAIHHLAVDTVSWRILLSDLQSAYRQLERGQNPQLPPRTTSFHAWARRLNDLAQSPDPRQQANFWLSMSGIRPGRSSGDLLIPESPIDQLNTEASARSVSVSLGYEETQAFLREVPEAYGTEIGDILLTALMRAFQLWKGTQVLLIDLEAHGREDIFDDIDLSRTVGWFTALYPVRLELPYNTGLDQSIRSIKEQLHQIPQHGLGYGLLRYLCSELSLCEPLKKIPPAQVSFNYLGQLPETGGDSIILDQAPEPIGPQRDPEATRSHLIEINAAIRQGELHLDWGYSSHVNSRQAIERVAGLFIEELRALIAHCRSSMIVGYTPSDFPVAGLSQVELDTIFQLTSHSNGTTLQRNLEAIYPLSPMQQGMVFHTLYTPESGIYFEQMTFTIQGEFDVSAFEKSWQELLERHAILRTFFVWQGLDRVLQVVHKQVRAPLDLQDWRGIPVSEQRDRFERLLIAERRQGFDLSKPPLLRLVILRTADDTVRVLLSHHHALLDGWSVSLLFEELFACYLNIIHNRSPVLPAARPYQDYIAWLQNRDLAVAEAFWRKDLAGCIPSTWGPGPDQPSSPPAGASQPAELNENLSLDATAVLQSFARQSHLTLSSLIQGAWAILLSRYFQRDEVLFGVTVSGRTSEFPGIINMLGLFINTLPLRVRIDRQSSLIEWLHSIQDKVIAMQQYDYSPLSQIQTWSGVSRATSLFDTLLVFENYPLQIPALDELDQLRIANIRSIEQTTYPLTLAVTPGQQLNLRVLYDPACFADMEIQNLLNHLRHVLEKMIANPDHNLSTLLRTTQFERDSLLDRLAGRTEIHSSQTNPGSHRQNGGRTPEKETAAPEEENDHSISPLVQHLVQQWQNLLKTDDIGVQDNFFQLGGDSLTGAICIYQLQNDMRETIPLAAIFEAPTISQFATYLEKMHPTGVARLLGTSIPVSSPVREIPNPTSIVPIQPKGSKPPLFCIHPAGGIVFPYYTLAACMDQDQPLYGVQDPSLYDEQSVPESIEAMAATYLQAIQKVQPEGPYHLLGWSAGGVVAYEIALQLSRQGECIAKLIVLDTDAPTLAKAAQSQSGFKDHLLHTMKWIKKLPSRFWRIGSAIPPVASYVRSGLFLLTASNERSATSSGGKPSIRDLLAWTGLDTWRTSLLREAEVASMVSQDKSLLLIKMPAVRRILGLVQEHRRLARRYEAEIYPGRMTLFRAAGSGSDKTATADPTLGWGALAEKGVEVRTIPANHVALLVKPHVEVLARELKVCLHQGE